MEKRVVLFMVLSAAIMMAYLGLQSAFAPPPREKPVAKKKDGDKKTPEKKEEKPDKPATPDKEEPDDPEDPAAKGTVAEQKWVTLGSIDPASPYRMLVTFNSLGGGIERIEMASPRYRDLDDRSGYLGHLQTTTAKGAKGAVVRVVGAGTPAALAVEEKDSKNIGLAPDDIIDGLNGTPITSEFELRDALDATKPGDEITLNVTRGTQKLVFATTLTRRPLEVIKPEVDPGDPKKNPDDPLAAPKTHPLSSLMSLTGTRKSSANSDPLRTKHWEVNVAQRGTAQVVEFTYRLTAAQAEALGLAGRVEVVRRYQLAEVASEEQDDVEAMAYHLDCEIEIRNLTDEKLEVAWQLDGPNGLPLEGWWYTNKIGPGWGSAGARDIVWRPNGWRRQFRTTNEVYKHAKKNPKKPAFGLLATDDGTNLDYIGVDAQYFSTILIPDRSDEQTAATVRSALSLPVSDVNRIKKAEYKTTNVTFRLTSDLKAIPAEGSYTQKMRLFAGPKVPGLLAKYTPGGYGMDDVIEYGWFKMISIPLAGLLHFLKHNLLFNYGLAIIALTVIVRGCMLPFSIKAAKSAKMMQELGPEMKKIKEKYKNDLQKQSEAQRELFKRHNYNPLSGCLPMFLQLPIFLGLYRALSTDIELRQAALIPGIEWASNLAGPDQLWYWKPYLWEYFAGETGWLGPYFNVLPLVSVALMLVHQKLFTPPATDEQMKMTQDMMKYMTVFMGLLFFKVPAGLCIYFITSSLWSVCERLWLPKAKPLSTTAGGDDTIVEKPAPAPKPKPSGNGIDRAERAARLKEKQRKR